VTQKTLWTTCFLGVIALAVLAGCGGSTPEQQETPIPTRTLRPAFTATSPPTATPRPSPTSAPPTPTPTPSPTSLVEATTEAAEPTPWPTLAANVCPLTGLRVEDESVLDRRPLAVKVENHPDSRPHAGLSQADVVYEHLTEGAITRFTAIFYCQDAQKIGPVRSARFVDLELPAIYQSALAFSGTSPGLMPLFENSDFVERIISPGPPYGHPGFHREPRAGIAIEHTMFTESDTLWDILADRDQNQRPTFDTIAFSEEPPEGGEPAIRVEVPYPHRLMRVEYEYDADSGTYLRFLAGEPHLDALTGEQLAFENVVVVIANHVDTDIIEDTYSMAPSIQIQLWGTGPAILFRDGQAYQGLWARPEREDMLVLRDETGQIPIPLRPGQTWVQLVPLPGFRQSFDVTWE
jgi:hypothetical protein